MDRLRFFQRWRKTRKYFPARKNSPLPKWLNWEQIEARPRKEGVNVVKGTNKRVVVVKSPDSRVFEQAIFIVREDYFGLRQNTSGDILREAEDVADQYMKNTIQSTQRKPLWPFLVAVGVTVVLGLLWVLLH